jgi:hypothetical protein
MNSFLNKTMRRKIRFQNGKISRARKPLHPYTLAPLHPYTLTPLLPSITRESFLAEAPRGQSHTIDSKTFKMNSFLNKTMRPKIRFQNGKIQRALFYSSSYRVSSTSFFIYKHVL